ncbi:putative Fe-containing alcohol dehydrogenase [Vararia minispora EC-137]|uniref:Fe-containing alcohol dehydrogenase n=1 Tax=Vararia minispora EC-137 TaxID=1314806 RepID=A0ACB8QFR3_9AGAM|nr:putative Fe-containing alcohol dehydrogenase [Vararia minispora EC-137]
MPPTETYRLAIPYDRAKGPLPPSNASDRQFTLYNNVYITYGLSFQLAVAKHVQDTLQASRAYVLVSKTLAQNTNALKDLEGALGDKIVGVKSGLKAHTSWGDVLSMKRECEELKADVIITLGGGSLTDAAKLLSLVLANDVHTSTDFYTKLDMIKPQAPPERFTAHPPRVPVICVPTTLSAGEYTFGAGATEDETEKKYQFLTGQAVRLLVLDAELVTRTTPSRLWIASGFRAIDHCVEGFVSPLNNTVTEDHAVAGLRLLIPGLIRCRQDVEGTDVEARHLGQMGALEAIAALCRVYTPAGGSHAIGHMLGPFGVSHGETSAILLPAVCDYNAKHNANIEQQRKLASVLWDIEEFRDSVAEKHGLKEDAELGSLLRALTRELGLPTTLKEVGVEGPRVQKLAEYSLLDPWARTNPVPLKSQEQVLEVLQPVIG